jgi:outer membrane receptor protein involved in Fe transport
MTFLKSSLALAVLASLANISLAENLPATNTISNDTDEIEVMTVIGDFRQQNIQTKADAITVLNGEDISYRNAQNLEELIGLAPNLNFSSGSQRARYYQIRGIGERSQFQETINPSVGLLIDGIDLSGIGSIASTFDINQIEIFRGPQGTRFGANAMAGIINISSNAPSDEFESAMQLKVGNYDSLGAGLVFSGPATKNVNYRFALEKYKSNGFIENNYLERQDTNNRDELTVRGKLAIAASDTLTIDLTVFHANFNNGYDVFSLDNTRETMSDSPGFDDQKTNALASKFTYTGISVHDVVIALSYADSTLAYGYDEDWSYVGLHPWEYSATDQYFRDKNTFTADISAISKQGFELFNGTTAWVAGMYLKQENEDLLRQYTYLSEDFDSTFDTNTYAAYVQLDSKLSKKLSLTTGLRYETRQADYQNSDLFDDSLSDYMLGGKIVLAYQSSADTLWYGQINRGFKAGGANTNGSLSNMQRTFSAEYLTNYELGYKVNLLNDNAYIRAAIFYMNRQDMQVKSSHSILHTDGSTEFIVYIDNAAGGINKGLELESAWQVNNTVEVYGALGLLKTELENFINAQGIDVSGREQAHAPNYHYNIGVNLQLTDNWLVNLSVEGKDSYYFSVSHDEKSQHINLANVTLTYSENNWKINLWMRNIFNEDYATRGFYFGNDPRDGYSAKQYTQLGEPQVFGITFDYQF